MFCCLCNSVLHLWLHSVDRKRTFARDLCLRRRIAPSPWHRINCGRAENETSFFLLEILFRRMMRGEGWWGSAFGYCAFGDGLLKLWSLWRCTWVSRGTGFCRCFVLMAEAFFLFVPSLAYSYWDRRRKYILFTESLTLILVFNLYINAASDGNCVILAGHFFVCVKMHWNLENNLRKSRENESIYNFARFAQFQIDLIHFNCRHIYVEPW